MYLMDELEPSLIASEPRRLLHSLALDDLPLVGDMIVSISGDLVLPVDSGAPDSTLVRDDRAKGLWKQNIVARLRVDLSSLVGLAIYYPQDSPLDRDGKNGVDALRGTSVLTGLRALSPVYSRDGISVVVVSISEHTRANVLPTPIRRICALPVFLYCRPRRPR